MYRLSVTTKQGDIKECYFNDYSALACYVSLFQFSSDTIIAIAQEKCIYSWKTLFKIVRQNGFKRIV